jgi:hypothetical protein
MARIYQLVDGLGVGGGEMNAIRTCEGSEVDPFTQPQAYHEPLMDATCPIDELRHTCSIAARGDRPDVTPGQSLILATIAM